MINQKEYKNWRSERGWLDIGDEEFEKMINKTIIFFINHLKSEYGINLRRTVFDYQVQQDHYGGVKYELFLNDLKYFAKKFVDSGYSQEEEKRIMKGTNKKLCHESFGYAIGQFISHFEVIIKGKEGKYDVFSYNLRNQFNRKGSYDVQIDYVLYNYGQYRAFGFRSEGEFIHRLSQSIGKSIAATFDDFMKKVYKK